MYACSLVRITTLGNMLYFTSVHIRTSIKRGIIAMQNQHKPDWSKTLLSSDEILGEFPNEHLNYAKTCSSKEDSYSMFNIGFDSHIKLLLIVITKLVLTPGTA